MNSARDAAHRPVNRLLRIAVVGGVEAAVALHIHRGDDVNARDDRDMTLLMCAAAKNRARICRLLIDAGADMSARDVFGNDAYGIALSAGALDAAREIELALAALTQDAHVPSAGRAANADALIETSRRHERSDVVSESTASGEAAAPPDSLVQALEDKETIEVGQLAEVDPLEPSGIASTAVEVPLVEAEFFIVGDAMVDLSIWEPDKEKSPPIGDASLALAPIAIHRAISLHEPVDDSADWSDFEAFLPDQAAPLPRSENAEVAAELRALLLRALREGSVPTSAVDGFDRVVETPTSADSKSPLRFVIEDLGAEIDERFEYRAPHENFEVHIAAAETADEERVVDEALAFLADLESRRNDPMRYYMREAQRKALIGAEEEAALAKAMENASRDAVDCLADWPSGLAELFEAIDSVRTGKRLANSISTGARGDGESDGDDADIVEAGDPSTDTTSVSGLDASNSTESNGDEAGRDGLDPATLFAKAQALRDLVESADTPRASLHSIRQSLHELGLTRPFLLRLADCADPSEPARCFVAAARRLGAARDQMVGANLRLVWSHAKRFLFSGIPMDDLIQEGNIGLIRAVDKFDWRRGYKFSTMATWWIRQQISRCVADTAVAIRLPAHFRDDVYLIERAGKDLERSLGKVPSIEQLADRLDMKPGKVAMLLRAVSVPLSIAELDDELASIGEVAPNPFDALDMSQLVQALAAVLDGLDSKQAKVVRLRFGIGVSEPCTLEEVGQLFGVTRERIRQIEAQTMQRLMHPARADALAPWLHREPPPRKPKQEAASVPTGSAETTARALGKPAIEPAQEIDTEPEAAQRLLAHASKLGIAVERTGSGMSSATWVLVDESQDNESRAMVGQLLALGFAHWPGRGYWK